VTDSDNGGQDKDDCFCGTRRNERTYAAKRSKGGQEQKSRPFTCTEDDRVARRDHQKVRKLPKHDHTQNAIHKFIFLSLDDILCKIVLVVVRSQLNAAATVVSRPTEGRGRLSSKDAGARKARE
jgi:hypothetical protein